MELTPVLQNDGLERCDTYARAKQKPTGVEQINGISSFSKSAALLIAMSTYTTALSKL